MAIVLDGTTGITTPGLTNTGTETLVNLTTTGNTILGDASTDTLNVGNGGLIKDASGNLGLGVTPSAWSGAKAFDIGSRGSLVDWSSSQQTDIWSNGYFNGSNSIYKTTNYASIYRQNNGQHIWFNAASGTAGNAITFTQAMTLDASGNLGVGTTSPTSTLSVGTLGTTSAPTITIGSSTSGSGSIYFGDGATASDKYRGYIEYIHSSDYMAFGTSATERARITSSGSLLVGTSTQTSNGVSSPLIQSNGSFYSSGSTGAGFFFENRSSSTGWYGWYATSATIYLYNGTSGVAGNIASINPSTGVYTALSDVNKKKDFESSNLGLAAVMQLKPTLYRMLDADENSAKELGFIAQDVKDVIPQAYVEVDNNETCASGSASKFIGLNDRAIVATLTKAIQEQQALITTLTDRITALESK